MSQCRAAYFGGLTSFSAPRSRATNEPTRTLKPHGLYRMTGSDLKAVVDCRVSVTFRDGRRQTGMLRSGGRGGHYVLVTRLRSGLEVSLDLDVREIVKIKALQGREPI
jgi:hypothetical protein